MARLIIFDDSVRAVDLPNSAVIIGRSLKVDIPIRDSLLSRKHCTLEPHNGCYRLVDLKSANGTFVNGGRIEKAELQFDDIVEIGNTVIVLLDTATWDRGEGLTRLRNPVKAQELVHRLKQQAERSGEAKEGASKVGFDTAIGRRRPPMGRKRRRRRQSTKLGVSLDKDVEAQLSAWLETELTNDSTAVLGVLEDYLYYKVVSLLGRRVSGLRRIMLEAMTNALSELSTKTKSTSQMDAEELRSIVREALSEAIETDRRVTAASGNEGSTRESPVEERSESGVSEAPVSE